MFWLRPESKMAVTRPRSLTLIPESAPGGKPSTSAETSCEDESNWVMPSVKALVPKPTVIELEVTVLAGA